MSRRNDPLGIRRQNIQRILKMIQGSGDVSLKRLLAACSINMGLTRTTTMRYLEDLVDTDLIKVDEAADVVREVKPAD